MYHRRERTTTARRTEDGTTEDSHVDFLNLIYYDYDHAYITIGHIHVHHSCDSLTQTQ